MYASLKHFSHFSLASFARSVEYVPIPLAKKIKQHIVFRYNYEEKISL